MLLLSSTLAVPLTERSFLALCPSTVWSRPHRKPPLAKALHRTHKKQWHSSGKGVGSFFSSEERRCGSCRPTPQQTPRSPAIPNGWLLSPFQIGRWGACDLRAVATPIAAVGHTDGEHCSMFRSDVIRSGTSCTAKHRAALRFHARRSRTPYRPSPHFAARGGPDIQGSTALH
jgi:hypothetical protein